jgi:hypothetical protein
MQWLRNQSSMRLLLDENFPVDFALHLVGHEVATINGLGWSGVKNGELLRRAHSVCDVFLTLDRNLEFQQNIKALTFAVIVVRARSNRIADLVPLVESILLAIDKSSQGSVSYAQ